VCQIARLTTNSKIYDFHTDSVLNPPQMLALTEPQTRIALRLRECYLTKSHCPENGVPPLFRHGFNVERLQFRGWKASLFRTMAGTEG
jgi:hypothetical protein